MLEHIGFQKFNFHDNIDYAFFLDSQGSFIAYKTPEKASAIAINIRNKKPLKIATMDKKNFYSWNFSHLIPFPKITKTKRIIKPEDIETILERENQPLKNPETAIYEVFYNALHRRENHKYKKKLLNEIEFPIPPEKMFNISEERLTDTSIQSLDEFFRSYIKRKAEKYL